MPDATTDRPILPAAGRLLPLAVYDAGLALTMRERVWRPALVRAVAAAVPPDGAVVEVGAGTGSLTARLRTTLPEEVVVTAVDPDAAALEIARRKTGHAAAGALDRRDAAVELREARAESLPLPDDSQDAVVMALMLHHLTPDAKLAALREAHRVLRPGGILFVADFGRPQDALMSVAFSAIELIDGRETTHSHRHGIVHRTIGRAGFAPPTQLTRLRTAGGTLELLTARAQRTR